MFVMRDVSWEGGVKAVRDLVKTKNNLNCI